MYKYLNYVGTQDSQSSSMTDEADKRFSDGINCVTIGEKVSYLLKTDELFAPPHRAIDIPRKFENNSRKCIIFCELSSATQYFELLTLLVQTIHHIS